MEVAEVAAREGALLEDAPPEASAAEVVVQRGAGWGVPLLVFVSVLAIYVAMGYAVYHLIRAVV